MGTGLCKCQCKNEQNDNNEIQTSEEVENKQQDQIEQRNYQELRKREELIKPYQYIIHQELLLLKQNQENEKKNNPNIITQFVGSYHVEDKKQQKVVNENMQFQQNDDQNNLEEDGDENNQEKNYTISSNEQQPDAIEIFFSYLRGTKYRRLNIQRPFLHGECFKKVWLYPDGSIKCEGRCPPFGIWEAYFNCLTNTVSKNNFRFLKNENFKTLIEYSEFIQNCLDNSNLSKEQQLRFQKYVCASQYFQYLMLQ